MEQLKNWAKAERGRASALAAHLGVRLATVSDWCAGKKNVSLEFATRIEGFTQKQVLRQHLFPSTWQVHWPELTCAVSDNAPQAQQLED